MAKNTVEEKKQRMQELIRILRDAREAYYAKGKEIISNHEYDALFDELTLLEEETGIILTGSPTVEVGYEVVSTLPKEKHDSRMLSLDKTKNVDVLQSFLGERKGLLSWKMDGLTVVLTYENGMLHKAVTRGNGEVGELVTENAKRFRGVPYRIPFMGKLVLRGEALISYSVFEALNAENDDLDAKYKNPRNLCSGSVRQTDPSVTEKRGVSFHAFALIEAENVDFRDSHEQELLWLKEQGFSVVFFEKVDRESLPEAVERFREKVKTEDFPSDGLVLLMDSIEEGKQLGNTARFPRNAMAFKWADEIRETVLREIIWSASRTGLLNPVAVFDPVELEGTTVKRASVHNVSIVKDLKLGIGDRVRVYKANMIIPQIAENLDQTGPLPLPESCPICGGKTEVRGEGIALTLHCTNPDCPAKNVNAFTLLLGRNALNAEGFKEKTIEFLVGKGYVHTMADLFRLKNYEKEWSETEGFGKKSVEKLLQSMEKARHTTLRALLAGIGIPGIGSQNARLLADRFQTMDALRSADIGELNAMDGIGPILAKSIYDYFRDEERKKNLDELLKELILEEEAPQAAGAKPLSGLSIVITGSLHQFENRKAFQNFVEEKGGSLRSSVSKGTDYLVNNDALSKSSKNLQAAKLGIPVLTEEDFLKMVEEREKNADTSGV